MPNQNSYSIFNNEDSNTLFEFIFEHLPDAAYWLDSNFKILYANEAAVKMLGYPKEELVGMCMYDISSAIQKENIKMIWSDLTVRKTVRLNSYHFTKNNQKVPVEVASNFVQFKGQDFNFAVIRDISVQLEKEREIQRTAEYYKLLANNVVDVVWEMDYHTRSITYISPSVFQVTGYTPEEFVQIPVSEVFSDDGASLAFQKLEDRYLQFKSGIVERYIDVFKTHRKDGNPFYIELHTAFYYAKSGKVTITGVGTDITERIKIESELREKNESLKVIGESKDKFLSVISHDLRGPIHSFASLTDFISKEMWTLPFKDLEDGLRKLNQSAVNISSLLENLLSWSRLQQGQIVVEPKSIYLGVILQDAANQLNDQAIQKNIVLEFKQVDPIIKISADEKMVQTVIRNLLSNAIKFSPKGSKIELNCYSLQDKVRLEVIDHGIGMDEMQLKSLFLPGNKANRKGTEGEPSSGLGLILVKEFVELNGGSMEVKSKKNEGSFFAIQFPKISANHEGGKYENQGKGFA